MAGLPTTAYDTLIQAATSEQLHGVENWELNIAVSDRICADGPAGARAAIDALAPRIMHRDSGVRETALSVAHGISENASPETRALEALASPVFCEALVQSATYRHAAQVYRTKVLEHTEAWYEKLEALGAAASTQADTMHAAMEAVRSTVVGGLARYHVEPPPPEHSVEELRQEDEDLRKALELSMQDTTGTTGWEGDVPPELEAALATPSTSTGIGARTSADGLCPPPPPPPIPAKSASTSMYSAPPLAPQGMPPPPMHPPPPLPSRASAPVPPAPRPALLAPAQAPAAPPLHRPASPAESDKTWDSAPDAEDAQDVTAVAPQVAPPSQPVRTPTETAATAAVVAASAAVATSQNSHRDRSSSPVPAPAPASSPSPATQPPTRQRHPSLPTTQAPSQLSTYTPKIVPGMVMGAPAPQRVQALHDFVPGDEGELSMKRGDVITVLEAQFDHWWRGESKGKIGIFPKNYVKPLASVTLDSLLGVVHRELDVEAMAPTIYALLEQLLHPPGPVAEYNPAADEELREMYTASLTAWSNLVGVMNAYATRLATMRALNETFDTVDKLFRDTMNRALNRQTTPSERPTSAPLSTTTIASAATAPSSTNVPLHRQAINYAATQARTGRTTNVSHGGEASSSSILGSSTNPSGSGSGPGIPPSHHAHAHHVSFIQPAQQAPSAHQYPAPPVGLHPSDPAYAQWYYENIGIPPGHATPTAASTGTPATAVPTTTTMMATSTSGASVPTGQQEPLVRSQATLTPTPISTASAPVGPQVAGSTGQPTTTTIPQPPLGLTPNDPAYAEWYYATFGPPPGTSQPVHQPVQHTPALTPTPSNLQQQAHQHSSTPTPTPFQDHLPAHSARPTPQGTRPQFTTVPSTSSVAHTASVTPYAGPTGSVGTSSAAPPPPPTVAPQDEEKRRLFDRAQAEVVQFQQQQHHTPDANMARRVSGSGAAPTAGSSSADSVPSTSSIGPAVVPEVPRDEEKRRLFERAQAEVAQFHHTPSGSSAPSSVPSGPPPMYSPREQ